MIRKILCGCLGLGLPCLGAVAGLPAWWTAFPGLPRLESSFVQESDSAVFGKLTRQGDLKLAKGGRLRVQYREGLLLVANGTTLIQYDPQARTAQRQTLRAAAAEAPLLDILLRPGGLGKFYEAKPGPDQSLALEPRQAGLPRVELTGRGRLLQRIQWTDGTGARQVIELKNPQVPAAPFDAATFTFAPPAGTRWLDAR